MCGPKKPKPPPMTDTSVDPELQRQRRQAEEENALIKGEQKDQRTADRLQFLMGRYGRRSLFSGGQGGKGYAAPRGASLFLANGASFNRGAAATGMYQRGERTQGGSGPAPAPANPGVRNPNLGGVDRLPAFGGRVDGGLLTGARRTTIFRSVTNR